jgi:hypothetical protein
MAPQGLTPRPAGRPLAPADPLDPADPARLARLEHFAARALDFDDVLRVLERSARTSLGARAVGALAPLDDGRIGQTSVQPQLTQRVFVYAGVPPPQGTMAKLT